MPFASVWGKNTEKTSTFKKNLPSFLLACYSEAIFPFEIHSFDQPLQNNNKALKWNKLTMHSLWCGPFKTTETA